MNQALVKIDTIVLHLYTRGDVLLLLFEITYECGAVVLDHTNHIELIVKLVTFVFIE